MHWHAAVRLGGRRRPLSFNYVGRVDAKANLNAPTLIHPRLSGVLYGKCTEQHEWRRPRPGATGVTMITWALPVVATRRHVHLANRPDVVASFNVPAMREAHKAALRVPSNASYTAKFEEGA